jgi:hypothetical protein
MLKLRNRRSRLFTFGTIVQRDLKVEFPCSTALCHAVQLHRNFFCTLDSVVTLQVLIYSFLLNQLFLPEVVSQLATYVLMAVLLSKRIKQLVIYLIFVCLIGLIYHYSLWEQQLVKVRQDKRPPKKVNNFYYNSHTLYRTVLHVFVN